MINLELTQKSFLIQWISNVLCQELNQEQFNQYQNGLFDPLFEALEEHGFVKQIAGIKKALTSLKEDTLGYLELAADFSEAFLLDGESSALPYASVYLSEEQLALHLQFMDTALNQFQLQLNKEVKEPSDHLGVYLEILVQFIQKASEGEQQVFIEDYLLPWLEPFHEKLQKIPTNTNFYQNIVDLLLSVLKQ